VCVCVCVCVCKSKVCTFHVRLLVQVSKCWVIDETRSAMLLFADNSSSREELRDSNQVRIPPRFVVAFHFCNQLLPLYAQVFSLY